ncbi:PilZ domain-containing protein [Flexibacterium corallicola]|uniref:PilZ domain-containing protein n=1 Tax=Flexibacterium corallicola TaxID=3037259 RepID=UPI00286F0366|nr:PilZ domain-containing protein [Pseudovibrio sp. M1P-2-3]
MTNRHTAVIKKISERRPERRRFSRVNVDLLGRCMMQNRQEYPCQIKNMSPGGAYVLAPVSGEVDDRVIIYVDHIGRVEGTITRIFSGGFALEIKTTERKQDKLAGMLTWLANKERFNLPEDRRHERFIPKNPFTSLILEDGTKHKCRILDVSLSGAAIKTSLKPEPGTSIGIGKMRARVIRHTEDGIALEFAVIHNQDLLEQHLGD